MDKQLSSVIPAQFVIIEQLSNLTELVHREWTLGLLWMWQSLSTKVWPDRFERLTHKDYCQQCQKNQLRLKLKRRE